jgi:hypothetical protein
MASEESDNEVAPPQYADPNMTAADFEGFVRDLFAQTAPLVDELRVTLHDRVTGSDGVYDFDAAVRYEWGGLAFLVVVEAKHHTNPIKREVVQVLHAKMQSVGAQKGVVVSTAPYQRGAVQYALAHGIALVKVTEGRFTLVVKSARPTLPPSRAAAGALGIPTFVGHCLSAGDKPGTFSTTLVTGRPEYAAELLLGRVPRQSPA